MGGQGQDATALCIKHRDLVVNQAESSLGCVPAMPSAQYTAGCSAGMLVLSCTLAGTVEGIVAVHGRS